MEKLIRIFENFAKPIKTYPRTVVFCSLLLWIPSAFANDLFHFGWRLILNLPHLLLTLFVVYLFCCVSLFVFRINKKSMRLILCLIHIFAYGIFFLELFLFILFDCKTNANIFQLIDETNFQETSEFVKGYLLNAKFAIVCGIPLLIAVLEFYSLKFLSVVKKRMKFRWQVSEKIFVEGITLLVLISGCYFLYNLQYFSLDFRENWKKAGSVCQSPVFYVFQAVSQFVQERDLFEESAKSNENIVIEHVDNSPKTIVLVIGESFNRHHSSLYGYPLKTNHKLESLENLYIFDDVIAPMNATSDVFRDFLSLASIDEKNRMWYQAPLFPAVFKKAGYNVVFYSNQFVAETGMSTYDASCGFFNHPSIAPKLFNHKNENKFSYDGELLDYYKKNRSTIESDSLNLVMFHLYGQHVTPESRYPQDRSFFTEKDYVYRKELNNKQKKEVANYDNATLYNDSIVYEIIQMYKNENAAVVYFADHGDEANDYRLHKGRSRGLDVIGAPGLHCQLDVPFFIWMSEKWKERYPNDENRINKHLHNRFITDDVPHVLLDLARIKTPLFNSKRSLINDEYNENRKRIITPLASKPVDYDSVCTKYGNWKIGF